MACTKINTAVTAAAVATRNAVCGEFNTTKSGRAVAVAGAVVALAGLFFAGLVVANLAGANLSAFGEMGKFVANNQLLIGVGAGSAAIIGTLMNVAARRAKTDAACVAQLTGRLTALKAEKKAAQDAEKALPVPPASATGVDAEANRKAIADAQVRVQQAAADMVRERARLRDLLA